MRTLSTLAVVISICGLPSYFHARAFAELKDRGGVPVHPSGKNVELSRPVSITISVSDILYATSLYSSLIYRLDLKSGLMTTIRPTPSPDGGFGRIQIDRSDNLIANAPFECRIGLINVSEGTFRPIAGVKRDPSEPSCGSDGDGGPSIEARLEPDFFVVDPAGNLFALETWHRRVRRIDGNSGLITTVIGPAQLRTATSLALNKGGDLFISQVAKGSEGRTILRLNKSERVALPLKESSFSGDKRVWIKSDGPRVIFTDSLGNLYVLDESHIFYIDLSKRFVSIVAGSEKGFAGDGGLAKDARLFWPQSLDFDSGGYMYVADLFNDRIRRIDAKTHIITTVAGHGPVPSP
jgi:hypothetical protein